MVDPLTVTVAATGGVTVACFYNRLTGCTRGHVWGEWADTDRWKVTPFDSKKSVIVERKRERHCECDGCSATESEYQQVSNEVYAEDAEYILQNIIEVYYECPDCGAEIADSQGKTMWKGMRHGQTRYETCPHCKGSSASHRWNRVPYSEVSE